MSKAHRLWAIEEQVNAYQSMKRRELLSKLFLFLLAAVVIAPIILLKFDWIIWIIGQLK